MSKPFAIFGAGLSAQAARRLAEAKGLSVVLIDKRGRAIKQLLKPLIWSLEMRCI